MNALRRETVALVEPERIGGAPLRDDCQQGMTLHHTPLA
jgi:hypothetical protein